jgi:hypothetical protein
MHGEADKKKADHLKYFSFKNMQVSKKVFLLRASLLHIDREVRARRTNGLKNNSLA